MKYEIIITYHDTVQLYFSQGLFTYKRKKKGKNNFGL